MAAEVEEILVHLHGRAAQRLRPQADQLKLQGVAWSGLGVNLAGAAVGHGQGLPVDLPVRCEGNRFYGDDRAGHHGAGQFVS